LKILRLLKDTDIMLENTQCYCNPMGYPGENTGFQIECIELD